ncbi:hypothetical protein [Aureibacter tunicatorum]|uniref:Uncharacterized protein n=1 Tax=Aureibacter tunicatorum TaxID=866807 RepID=A0AAE3XQN0_9BACT|nr:hypothetical protein [Aureibacter tunicatorum]MDR6240817.1 hypothetical protein [Aureibacter tunicatorum]BDD06850.1 hypothetical protein AUTU_43330 [Aureibacter tunicatorum]
MCMFRSDRKLAHSFKRLTLNNGVGRKPVASAFTKSVPIQALLSRSDFQHKQRELDSALFDKRLEVCPLLYDLEESLDEYQRICIQREELNRSRSLKAMWFMSFEHGLYRDKDEWLLHYLFDLIDKMEHMAYEWLDGKISDLNEHAPFASSMLYFLNELHKEHVFLSQQLVSQQYRLWTKDRDTISAEEQTDNDKLWQAIVNNQTSLNITGKNFDKEGYRQRLFGFEHLVHSHMLRLMSRPKGRKLIERAANASKSIIVGPSTAKKSQAKESYFLFRDKIKGKWKGDFDLSDPFKPIEPGRASATNIILSIYDKNDIQDVCYTDSWKAMPCQESEEKGENDWELTAEGLKPLGILTGFLVFAHEIGHALNNAEGVSRPVMEEYYQQDPKLIPWRNNEEHYVIEQFENPVREEHGLAKRKWHLVPRATISELFPRLQPSLIGQDLRVFAF